MIRVAAVASSVLSSGVLFGTVAALSPSKRTLDHRTYVTVQQATIRNLRPVMGWTSDRDRWEAVHLIRTATALIGLAGTLAGAVAPGTGRR
jgi:hypothetical protein